MAWYWAGSFDYPHACRDKQDRPVRRDPARGHLVTAIGLSVLAAFGFGSASVFARSALQGIPLLPAIWLSLVVSFALSAALVVAFAFDDIGKLSVAAFIWVIALAVIKNFGGRSQNYMAVNIIGASRASLFFATQAPFSALLALVFLEESITVPVILGTIAVVAGLLAASGDSLLEGWRTERKFLLGYLLALSAGAAYGSTNIVFKKAVEQLDSPLVITALSLLVGLVLLLPFTARSASRGPTSLATNWSSLRFVILAGLAAGVGVNALYFALQRADVVIVGAIVAANPLITLLMAHIFISRLEQVTVRLAAGTALAVVGVILVAVSHQL